LQGIQSVADKIYVSGSSSDQGYLGVYKRDGNTVRFLGIKTRSENPYTHAGGFQVSDEWLAIGCENAKKKMGSLVVLQKIGSAAALAQKPSFTMERTGDKKVSTAGSVAILKRKDHFLLAVGTWDCATMDLYISNHSDSEKEDFNFTHWTTWEAATTRHRNWVDRKWMAYQNIQLFEDSGGVYLVATGKSGRSDQVADVFLLDPEKDRYEMLTKIRHRVFELPPTVSFRNGAGMVRNNGIMQLWAVSNSIAPKTMLAVFSDHET
jgi:hypothetical protein